ncbi:hypothetical protein C7U61_14470 [Rhizobium sp. JAB6]|nr:hypothetical protein C7U61_14470 [Rhizobium sp. JAB6]
MVAEDRFNLFLRLDSPSLIDLGNWQVELKRAIKQYLEKTKEVDAANDVAAPQSILEKPKRPG